MAINKNHEFEELNGVKCAIVEKNVSKPRADFLERILRFNQYEVMVIPAVVAQSLHRQLPHRLFLLLKCRRLEPEAAPAPELFTVGCN
jgi:hypothetical protein